VGARSRPQATRRAALTQAIALLATSARGDASAAAFFAAPAPPGVLLAQQP
jgi:hypothetical protein